VTSSLSRDCASGGKQKKAQPPLSLSDFSGFSSFRFNALAVVVGYKNRQLP
jgi:hypothetical protein